MRLRLPAAVLVCALTFGGLLTAVPGASAAPVAAGSDWTVTEADGIFTVTLRLDKPLPTRAAEPVLEVDGDPVGTAEPAGDGRSVSVRTTDPDVASATTVTLTWDGVPDDEEVTDAAGAAAAEPAATVLADDPATPGRYRVARADYDLGNEVYPIADIPGERSEIRGAIYYPADRTGAAPVAVFLHGRHKVCAGDALDEWPCPHGDIPSYLGYDAAAQVLASNGVVVVSISANAINAFDNGAFDLGATARGDLVLHTLDLLAAANTTGSPGFSTALRGRLDLDDVGLMGHSRGGEGVVRAAQLNLQRAHPYGIRSVMPLAPTDFNRLTVPGVVTATVLPYCDGDVADLQGQHYTDDSRYAFDDSVLRSTVLVMGANHNFFNSIWSPGGFPSGTADDWSYNDTDQSNPVCGASAPTRLSQTEQRSVGVAYLSAFFRLTLAGEQQFLPLFDGSKTTTASLGRADIRVTAQAPAADRIDVARLTGPAANVVTDQVDAQVCAGTGTTVTPGTPACATLDGSQLPHWTPARAAPRSPSSPMLHLRWSVAGGTVRMLLPAADRDVSRTTALTFDLAPDATAVAPADLTVAVVDGAGEVATVPGSALTAAQTVLPGAAPLLRKVILRGVTVPLTTLTALNPLLDATDVREVRFTTGAVPGGAYLSDVAFGTMGLGTPGPTALSTLRIASTTIEQGERAGTGRVAVLRSSGTGVASAAVTVTDQYAGEVLAAGRVSFTAGDTCVPFEFPMPARPTETRPAPELDVALADVTGASPVSVGGDVIDVGQAGDPVSVGAQGDVCAEATAGPGALSLTHRTVAAGAAVTGTATGFRAGETVTLTGLSEEITAQANAAGVVALRIAVPAGTRPGAVALTATGYGSHRVATASLQVIAPAPISSSASSAPSSSSTSSVPSSSASSSSASSGVVTSTSSSSTLAATGAAPGRQVFLGGLLLVAGLALLLAVSRGLRRKRSGGHR